MRQPADLANATYAVGELLDCSAARPGLYVKVVRKRADSRDPRRCGVCGQPFGYAPIGQRLTDGALVHFTHNCAAA